VATYFCLWRNKYSVDHAHHIDPSDRTNNNYWNLIFVSVLEHVMIHDKLNYYNPRKGDNHPNAKYSNAQIENTCMLMEEGTRSNKEISYITGVSVRDIGYIRYGRNWKHISCKYNIPKLKDVNRETKFYDDNIIHEICKLICDGKSNKEISDILHVKHDTVSNIRRGVSHKNISSQYGLSIL
jgi:DNA-binding CsgD family transcriptional regulator